MRRFVAIMVIVGLGLIGCAPTDTPEPTVPGPDAPFPPTWTPTAVVESTPTATLVVQPTPTWDGTPPPPSEADVPRVSPARLYRELETGAFTVVDLRSFAAYTQARIAGSVHILPEELPDRVGELDGNTTIVLYGASLDESTSAAAAMFLYDLGFSQVLVLEGGLQRWYSEGYPIDGTWLTPTPGAVAPPWTVTPLAVDLTPTVTLTAVLATSTVTPTATATD